MRVLFISEYFFPVIHGGGELSAYYLAKHLAAHIEVHVLTAWFPGLQREEILDGIHFHRLLGTGRNPKSFFSNVKRLLYPMHITHALQKLAHYDFDIIHCMNMTSLHVVKAKKKLRAKFIAHVNSPLFLWPTGILTKENIDKKPMFHNFIIDILKNRQIGRLRYPGIVRYNPIAWLIIYQRFRQLRRQLKNFDAWIAISPFIAERLEYPASVLPNIIPLQEFLALVPQSHKKPVILYLGQYEAFKGPHIMLEALARVNVQYTCVLHGSGTLQLALAEFIHRENLSASLQGDIAYSAVPQAIAACDIVVFPSLVADAFGRVIVEAMAAGKPVIGSDIGGIRDIIQDKKTGLLCAPGDAIDLAQKLTLLLENSPLRKSLGAAARQVAARAYAPEKITQQALNIYRRVLHAKRN